MSRKASPEQISTAIWIEPYTALGVEKCVHPGCEVAARPKPFYSAYCGTNRHKKRLIRFELTEGERAAAAIQGVTLGPGDDPRGLVDDA